MAKNYWDLKYFDKDTLAFVDTIAQVENVADAPFIFNRNFEISSTEYLLLPSGTTAERPSDVEGRFRYNNENNNPEYYNGSEWVQVGGAAQDAETVVFKSADEGRSSLTRTADADLTIPVSANTIYYWETRLFNTSTTSGQFTYTVSGPTGSTFFNHNDLDTINSVATDTDETDPINVLTSANFFGIDVRYGFLETAGTSGNITVNWAKRVSSASDTFLLEKSLLRIY